MADGGVVELDIAAIRRGQAVARIAALKRERQVREAAKAAAAARADAADAAQGAAEGLLRSAVAACSGTTFAGASALLARVGCCERGANAVAQARNASAETQRAWVHAQTLAAARASELVRARARLERSREHLDAWRSREQLAVEVHAELAFEDEPTRSAEKGHDGQRR
jgi:hypothetical protein